MQKEKMITDRCNCIGLLSGGDSYNYNFEQLRRVYGINGLSPTLSALHCNDTKILIDDGQINNSRSNFDSSMGKSI